MVIEHIKVGHRYYAPVEVEKMVDGDVYVLPIHVYQPEELVDAACVRVVEGQAEACRLDRGRLFRRGDRVKLVEWQGRKPFDSENWEVEVPGLLCVVAEDETENEGRHVVHVWRVEDMPIAVDDRPWMEFCVHSLELVAPVEVLEPFYVLEDDSDCDCPLFVIQNRCKQGGLGLDMEVARFVYGVAYADDKETVRARAEGVCEWFNAEHRKGVGL